MKTKLTDKQKSEMAEGARMAAARTTGDEFGDFWNKVVSDDPAIHGKWVAKHQPLIRPRKH